MTVLQAPVIFAAGSSSSTATALLELGLLFVAAAIIGRLARRIGLSAVPFYLLGGLFLGEGSPIALGASERFIEVGGTIGVVLLLFFLGLEYTAEELVTNLRANRFGGALDLINMVPGMAAALLLGWGPIAALVMGGVTYSSSSGIIAKLLADLGRMGNRETPVILSILVIEDLVMALYLPILAGVVVGGTVGAITIKATLGIAVVVAVIAVTHRFGGRISQVIYSRTAEVFLFSLMGVTMVVAGSAELLGISAGVGAFLVGVAVSGHVQQGAQELMAPLRDMFAAAFFIFFTFQIDPSTLPPALVPAVLLGIVSIGGKLVTGALAARKAGLGVPARCRAGFALTARGEFSIVIAGIAVAAGVDQALGAVTATYVLLLAVAAPVMVRFLEPTVVRWANGRSR